MNAVITIPPDPSLRTIKPGDYDRADVQARFDALTKELENAEISVRHSQLHADAVHRAEEYRDAVDAEHSLLFGLLHQPLVGDIFAPVPNDGLTCTCGALIRDRATAHKTGRRCGTCFDQLLAANASSGPRPANPEGN